MWQDKLKAELETVRQGRVEYGGDIHSIEKIMGYLDENATTENTIKQLKKANLNWFAGKLINNLYE